jgi:type I site-specific restriction endonuclease
LAKEDYDLVLVDEAHRYRNHTSQMFGNLQRICKAREMAKV